MTVQNLNWPNARLKYYPDFLGQDEADLLFEKLRNETRWQQDRIKVFGKVYDQPRLTALYADNDKPYSYSSITMHPHLFTPTLSAIKNRIEDLGNYEFSTCLLNLYRNGKDSNGWHADNEKELGINPVIASLSLGAERAFKLKHRHIGSEKHKIILKHGSLLIMEGETQHFWLHQVPKTSKKIGERINLTYRLIK